MYYVSDSHYLSSCVVEGTELSNEFLHQYSNYSTAVDTRSLSVTLVNRSETIPFADSLNGNIALLYYENPTGNVSALLQRSVWTRYEQSFQWLDITSQSNQSLPGEFRNVPNSSVSNYGSSHTLHESLANTRLGTPFTSGANFVDSGVGNRSSLGMRFNAPSNDSLVYVQYDLGLTGSGTYSEVFSSGPMIQYDTIHQSDVATIGDGGYIWINGTQPVKSSKIIGLPNNSFPFARLASVSTADWRTFLYHQMNGTTLAEELWDEYSKTWLASDFITVSES